MKTPNKTTGLHKQKTNVRWKWMAAVAIAATWTVAPRTYGGLVGIVDTVTFTENSSTSLTGTFTDSKGNTTSLSVTPMGADKWQVGGFPSDVFFNGNTYYWSEPENPGLVNSASFTQGSNVVTVESDVPIPVDTNPLANGQGSVPVGNDTFGVIAYFNDNAAASEIATVPDNCSTLGLLALGVGGVIAVREGMKKQQPA